MTLSIYGNTTSSRIIRGPNSLEGNFNLTSQAVENIISAGGTEQNTIDDVILNNVTSATIDNEHHILIEGITPGYNGVKFQSLDTNIATVDSFGITTRVANGTARFIASSRLRSKKICLNFSRTSGATTSEFVDYAAGSLAKALSTNIDSRLSGKQKAIYSTQNHADGIYIRNPNCILSDLDHTCISPWNSTGGNKRAGTLISPRHIIFAEHYQISTGAIVRFVTQDNVVVNKTMTNKQSLAGGSGYETDLTIGVLDSDVPNSISFARVIPTNWADYLPSLSHIYKVPAIAIDQQEKALVNELRSLSSFVYFDIPDDSTRLSFYESLIGGDSGNPSFLVDDYGLVLVTTWTYGGAGSGPNIANWIDEINAIMTSLGGGYQLTVADWSGYNDYS
jgi:hypothetical protein